MLGGKGMYRPRRRVEVDVLPGILFGIVPRVRGDAVGQGRPFKFSPVQFLIFRSICYNKAASRLSGMHFSLL